MSKSGCPPSSAVAMFLGKGHHRLCSMLDVDGSETRLSHMWQMQRAFASSVLHVRSIGTQAFGLEVSRQHQANRAAPTLGRQSQEGSTSSFDESLARLGVCKSGQIVAVKLEQAKKFSPIALFVSLYLLCPIFF